MEFRTEFKQKLSMPEISYESSLLLLGSCFSDVMAQKFSESKFTCVSNPFGVIFNTASLRFWFEQLEARRPISERDLVLVKDYFVHFQAHSKFNATSPSEVLNKIQAEFAVFQNAIHASSHIFITLGTAWVYRRVENDEIVANCHKAPQAHFRKGIQSISEIFDDLCAIKAVISRLNPEAKLIFTVSPVRHLKDGFVENQRSKAHLIAALHQYLEKNTEDYYFPSYELLLDDLRDYRFYGSDLLHPNEFAIAYIWEHVQRSFFSEETLFWKSKIDAVLRDLSHKPQYRLSMDFALHIQKTQQKIEEISKKWPHMMFIVEKK